MGSKGKILITDEGRYDLNTILWDDNRFSELLTRGNPIGLDQALDISRLMREQIDKMEFGTITLPVIEKMIEAKLMEFGISKTSPVRLDKSLFVNGGLSLSDNAITVLERRYLKRDGDNKLIETPEQMFRRVAHHIAKAEKKFGRAIQADEIEAAFFQMITELKFLPNSPTLMNAGRDLGQLAACFVLPVEDSMEGIFDALKNAAMIHKSGGGTGFSFSRLRPKKAGWEPRAAWLRDRYHL